MKEELTLTEISRLYGYTINAAKKWQERGMPFNTNTDAYRSRKGPNG